MVLSLKKGRVDKKSSLTYFSDKKNSNSIYYLSADKFQTETWERLGNRQFNMIFSDGVHSPEALNKEMDYLIEYNLIDREKFVMLWDDMWEINMQNAFLSNALKLCQIFGCGEENIALYEIHGTYGLKRKMGLFFFFGE